MNVVVCDEVGVNAKKLIGYLPDFLDSNQTEEADIAINFDLISKCKGNYYTFNQNCAVLDNETEAEILLKSEKIHTVKNYPYRHYWKAKYHVEIFDLKVLRVLARYSRHKSLVTIKNISTKIAKQVCEIAINTLYTLGLDFGIVTICITENDHKVVQTINIGTDMSERSINLMSKWIDRQKHIWEREVEFFRYPSIRGVQPLQIGADPEFLLYDRYAGRWLIASEFFPRNGLVGTDARAIYYPRHGYPLAELRPHPARSPGQLVENIRKTMQIGLRYLPCRNIAWIAGSCPLKGFPIGGHIHFSCLPNSRLLRALDNYLSISLLMLEKSSTAIKRRKKYGRLGDFRIKSHGGFEYRTPASWLMSEEITLGVLTLSLIIALNYPLLKINTFQSANAREAYYQCDKEFFRTIVLSLWHDLRKCPAYKKYQKEIKQLELMVINGHEWHEAVDLRRNWRINLPRQICKRV